MKKKISIKDIAAELGVSITTVSFVINGRAREKKISHSVTKRVEELVLQKRYLPNSIAQSLRTGRSRTIGFLVDDISEPFFSSIARHIDEEASAKGYKLIIASTGNNKEKALEMIDLFRLRQVDGLIISLADGIEDALAELKFSSLPYVLFDRPVPALNADTVVTDNKQSVYEATKHLIDIGSRKITFITIETTQRQMLERMKGYVQAVTESGLDLNIKQLRTKKGDGHAEEICSFLSTGTMPDAVIFSANYITMAGLWAMKKLGIEIRKDLAVVAFDDFELLKYLSITAIAQPAREMGVKSIEILLGRINGKYIEENPVKIVLPSILSVRQSSTRG